MSEVTIYVKDGCPYCAAAIQHYTEQRKAFREIDIHQTPGAKEKVLALTKGQAIVPVIVENDEIKIGFGGG